jgi:2,3-bisphosphoglycerate-independent phosphoglycerate mutase
MKFIMIIGDGMGDEPIAELGDRTPLQAALTPVMDRLASKGEQLLVRTVPEGYPPGSDVANLSLLGYAPEKYYTGRAPLEAASMGVDLGGDEIAYRCNLVTLEQVNGQVVMRDYSAGHISTRESRKLILAVQEACGTDRVKLHPGIAYRHLLVRKDGGAMVATVPPHDHLDEDVTGFYKRYLQADDLGRLMKCSAGVLAEHPVNRARLDSGTNPANSLWLWGEGRSPAMPALADRYGLQGVLVSAVDLLKGIGVYAGLEVPDVKGATGYIDTNYAGKVAAALDGLTRGDLAVIHLEGPDEAGHQGSLADKVQAIEDLDAQVVAPMLTALEKAGEPFRMVVCMDHYTPLSLRTHVDWPVPMFLYDSGGVASPSGLSFSETNARQSARDSGFVFAGGEQFFDYFIQEKGQ